MSEVNAAYDSIINSRRSGGFNGSSGGYAGNSQDYSGVNYYDIRRSDSNR